MPPFGLAMATLYGPQYGLQSFHHPFAVTDDPVGLALFRSPRNGQEFSSKDRLQTAKKGQPGLSPVSVTQPTPHLRKCGLLLCLPDPSVQTVCTPALMTNLKQFHGLGELPADAGASCA
eukprot:3582344-Amphidinium_carterae.1